MQITMIFLVVLAVVVGSMVSDVDAEEKVERAIFGGGCFWCMEAPFETLEGVIDVRAGYSGGEEENPTYEQVSMGLTKHLEAVEVLYDPEKITFNELVEVFWRQIDPTDEGGQFADRGDHYRTAIFYKNEEQRLIAEQSKRKLDDSKLFSRPVVTEILPVKPFYPAEEYHQDYYKKNVLHYSRYKVGSGRTGFLERVWKEKDEK